MTTPQDKFNFLRNCGIWLESVVTGLPERLTSNNGRMNVRNIPGVGTFMLSYDKAAVTTARQELHLPAGSKVTEISILAVLATPGVSNSGEFLKLVLDAPDDAAAILMIASQNDLTVPNGWMPIPLNEVISVPLKTPLANGDNLGGRLDFASEVSNLDIWIGLN